MALASKIFIRRAEREDLDVIVGWMEDPDFQHFLYGEAARSPRRIREQIVGMLGKSSGQLAPAGIYLMLDSLDYGPLGLISIQSISWRNHSCSLDLYMGNKKLRSRVVAPLGAYRALEYCFDELNMNRITTFIYSFNTPSWRLMELTGAKREVVLPKHVPRDGELYDLYCYGLLRREFDAYREKHRHHFPPHSYMREVARQAAKVRSESQPTPETHS